MDPFKRKSDGDHGNIMKSLWDKFLDIKEIIVILILLTGLTSSCDINEKIIYILAIIILTGKFGDHNCMKNKIENYDSFIKGLDKYKGIRKFIINHNILQRLIWEFSENMESFNKDCINTPIKYIIENNVFGYRESFNRFRKKYVCFIDSYCQSMDNIERDIGYKFSRKNIKKYRQNPDYIIIII